MISRRVFLPSAIRAITFALVFLTPISGIAGLFDSVKSIKELQVAYKSQTKKLAGDAEKQGVKKGVIDMALDAAESNSQKVYSAEEVAKLEEEVEKAKEKEQSTANKMLGGLTMAATGIGGMQLMQGLAEKKADEEGAADMKAYLDTIKCGISGGMRNVKYNEVGQTPTEAALIWKDDKKGNKKFFSDARLEYAVIVGKMKAAKENLGLAPGIEAETIVDTSRLYDNAGTDTDGINHRLDTATQRADSKSGEKRAIIGGVVAGAGVVGGLIGNAVINGKKDDKDDKKDEKNQKKIDELDKKIKDLEEGRENAVVKECDSRMKNKSLSDHEVDGNSRTATFCKSNVKYNDWLSLKAEKENLEKQQNDGKSGVGGFLSNAGGSLFDAVKSNPQAAQQVIQGGSGSSDEDTSLIDG
jgi:hypothetical protein